MVSTHQQEPKRNSLIVTRNLQLRLQMEATLCIKHESLLHGRLYPVHETYHGTGRGTCLSAYVSSQSTKHQKKWNRSPKCLIDWLPRLTISWCLKALKTIRYLNSDPTPNHIHRVSSRHGYDTSTGSSSKAQEWSKLSILCGTYKCC